MKAAKLKAEASDPKAYQRLPAGASHINVMVMLRLRSDHDQDLLAWFASLAPRARAKTIKAILRRAGLRVADTSQG